MITRLIMLLTLICTSNILSAKMAPGVANTAIEGTLIFTDKDGNSLGSIGPSERLRIDKDKFPVSFVIERDCNQTNHKIRDPNCYTVSFGKGTDGMNCSNYGALMIDKWGCFW